MAEKGKTSAAIRRLSGPKKQKFKRVMREFEAGDLTSSSGEKVTKQNQAVAIALSEARRAGREKG